MTTSSGYTHEQPEPQARAEPDGGTGPETRPLGRSTHTRQELLLALVVGFVLPVGLYYLLRALGVAPVIALLIGGAPALARTVYKVVRERKVDKISLFTLSLLAAGALASFITGSPRWLLAKGGVYTGIIGVWLLWSLRGRTIALEGILTFQKSDEAIAAWEKNWREVPEFRHVMRATTVIWGVGFLLEAVIRVILAYILPVDVVPAVTTVQFIVLLALMLWVAPFYGRKYMTRHGLTTGPDGIGTVRIAPKPSSAENSMT